MPEHNLNDLGKRIKAARKAKERTQDEVADAIGIGKTTLSEWERGLKQPGLLNILNYCNFLGITLDELLGVNKTQILHIEVTEEERKAILSMFQECQEESEISHLHSKLRFLEQYINALFSRAHNE